MRVVIHKDCSGPAMDSDDLVREVCALPVESFPFTCFPFLDEITDDTEVRYSEELAM